MTLTFSSCSKNVHEVLGRKNIQPPSCLRCTVSRKERLYSQVRQRGYNKLIFVVEIQRYLKEHVCGTQHPIHVIQLQKTAAKAGTERNQSTENASVALQQPILTHAHSKCPPVAFTRLIAQRGNDVRVLINAHSVTFERGWLSGDMWGFCLHG